MIDALIIGLTLGCVHATVAVGFSLIFRTTGVISFAQGSFVMVGAMVTAYASDEYNISLPIASLIGVAATGLAGLVLALAIVLPLWRHDASPLTIILGTVLFLIIVQNLVLYYMSSAPRSLPAIVDGGTRIGSTFVSYQVLIVLTMTAVIAFGLNLFIVRSNTGRAMRACAADRTISAQLGIRVTRIAILVFTLTAILGAISGILVVPLLFVSYSSAMSFNVRGFAAAILGGISDVRAALLGGLTLGVLESMIATFVSSAYLDVLVLIMLLLVLLLRPTGLYTRSRGSAGLS